MIDWLTFKLPYQYLSMSDIEKLREDSGRIVAINADGSIDWEVAKWESVRSDSHQIAVRFTDALYIQGSPARVGQDENVFGSDDIVECFYRVKSFVDKMKGIKTPDILSLWTCRRVDITFNYDLENLATVQQALTYLKFAEGGHYRADSKCGDTVYWNQRSRLQSGKAYAKGPHLEYQVRKGKAMAVPSQIELANRLLRLELKLGGQFWREEHRSKKPWHQWTSADFQEKHESYFLPLLGNLKVDDMNEKSMYEKVREAATTEGQARNAWATYCRIKAEGYRNVEKRMKYRTWLRHKKILMLAGISLAQLNSGTVVPLARKKTITLGEPIQSWESLTLRKSA